MKYNLTSLNLLMINCDRKWEILTDINVFWNHDTPQISREFFVYSTR